MESRLPEGWAEGQLEELLISLVSGSRPKGGVRGISEGIPSVGGEHLNDDGGFDFSNIKFVPKQFALKMSRGQIKAGDVLIVKDGATTGKTSYVSDAFPHKQAVVNEHVFICRSSSELASKYLFYFLWSREGKERVLENFKGSAQGGINTGFVSNTLIPLPPLAEQHRIVAKLDAVMQKVESNKQRLDKIPKLLKRFRQSVLAAAVSGRLTEAQGYDEIVNIPLGQLIDDLKYGTSQKSEKNNNGVPILRIPNIGEDGKIITDDLKFANLPKREFEKLKLEEGDILLIRSNGSVSLLGRAAIVSKEQKGFAYAGYLIRARCNRNKLLPEFLIHVLASYDIRMQIELPSRSSSGVNNINSDEVKALSIPSFTIVQQKEIVRRVKQLFAFADKLETRYTKAKGMLDKLPQSILAKAFRGELVSQDPNDEPAGVLLERIKAEKEKLAEVRKYKKAKAISIKSKPSKKAKVK